VNATIAKWREGSITINDDEKLRLRRDLDPVVIGEYTGFKTLEVARIAYRTRMNTLFSCGIIADRIDTIKNLKALIAKKIKVQNSEIQQKLQKEVKKLEASQNKLKCNIEKQEMIINVVNSTSLQYCHYRHYLNYLESNATDLISTQNIEVRIGNGSGTRVSTNTNDWVV